MASEAQRLINISLGKIANSRNQRGGLRLHKSLMVANIIVQARTQAMMESIAVPAAVHQPSRQPATAESDGGGSFGSASRLHEAFRMSSFRLDYDSDSDQSLDSDDDEMSVDFELDFGREEEAGEESGATEQRFGGERRLDDSPASSLRKRRRSHELDEEEDPSLRKPAKRFFPSPPSPLQVGSNGLSLSAMDCTNGLLDSLQMCHLDRSASTCFSSPQPTAFDDRDFVGHSRSVGDYQLPQSEFEGRPFGELSPTEPDSYDSVDDYSKDISLFQVEGLNEVVSCSTQIREALDTLTRPVISLAV